MPSIYNLFNTYFFILFNNFYSFEFNPSIYYSCKLLINLKNVIPKEKISHFSGINYPISYYPLIIYLINSGAI